MISLRDVSTRSVLASDRRDQLLRILVASKRQRLQHLDCGLGIECFEFRLSINLLPLADWNVFWISHIQPSGLRVCCSFFRCESAPSLCHFDLLAEHRGKYPKCPNCLGENPKNGQDPWFRWMALF